MISPADPPSGGPEAIAPAAGGGVAGVTTPPLSVTQDGDPTTAPTQCGEPDLATSEPCSRAGGPWPLAGNDRYELVERLGSGGMGRVYEAVDHLLQRRVAIKVVNADSPELVERLRIEAQAQARVEHPAICKVFEVGEANGHPFIVMQRIHGGHLQALAGQLGVEQIVLILREVAGALHEAHRTGLIHRDLKPTNIMLERTDDGVWRPFVVDFGLARVAQAPGLTVTGMALGTPGFMSPEQATGNPAAVDRRTDVWGLGATLYAALAGIAPFCGSSPVETILKVVQGEPVPLRQVAPAVPRDLETVVMKCLERDPARRYPSARALALDLQRFLDGEPVAARQVGALGRWLRRARRHPVVAGATAVAALTILVLGALWLEARRTVTLQAALAQRFGQQVEAAEGLLWRAQSLEAFDVRPVRAQVRARLAALSAEVERSGRLAAGPGHAALGRGFLALGELPEARLHLDKAWDAGFRTPETALALGLALGREYERELHLTARLPTEERASRQRALARELRDPALAHLRLAVASDGAAGLLVQAHIALYEGQLDRARAIAARAFSVAPWEWEASWIEARARRLEGTEACGAGQYATGLAAFAEADRALQRGLRVGRAVPQLHRERCELREEEVHARVWLAGEIEVGPIEAGIAVCRTALEVDADDVEIRLNLANLAQSQAELALGRGEDPARFVQASMTEARHVLALQPRHSGALSLLALALWQQGKHLLGSEQSALETLREAATAARRALQAEEGSPQRFLDLGLILLDLATAELAGDDDPTASVREAVKVIGQGWERFPGQAAPGVNLGIALSVLLEYQVAQRDPQAPATAAAALRALERAQELNPRLFWTPRTVGEVRAQLAEYQAQRGADPVPDDTAAAAAFDQALALNPNDKVTYSMLAGACVAAIRHALASGQPGGPWIPRARSALARGFALDASYAPLRFHQRQLDELLSRVPRAGEVTPAGPPNRRH